MIEGYKDSHEFECNFYNQLAPILDAPVPKVFKTVDWIYGKQDGCLHMEDLSKRGKCLMFFHNITLTQVKVFIRKLAHMHKNILSADPKLWRGKYLKNQAFLLPVIDICKPMIEPFLEKSKREGKWLIEGTWVDSGKLECNEWLLQMPCGPSSTNSANFL